MNRRSHAFGAKSSYRLWRIDGALPRLAVVLICGLLPTSVRAAVTFMSSDVSAFARAELRDGNRFSEQTSTDFVFTPQEVSGEAGVLIHNGPADHSSTQAMSTGTFTDATAGTISLVGSADMDTATRPDSRFALNEYVMKYSYDFSIDQAEPFTFDYSVLDTATPLDPADGFVNFQPYQFKLTNMASGTVATGSFSSGDTGTIAVPLGFDPSNVQSGTYHLEVSNFARGFLGVQTSATFNSTGNFDFKIGALDVLAAGVPEPSSWMTMIVGFGAAGSMARRRQRPSEPSRKVKASPAAP
jgi:hypothetical protein